ncbi:MAG: glycerol-3-phosphate acyltransferase [Candidatus Cloacimonetes bacterium]|nr:glycerol-3-phosphate acyltransferase [Candidatus Cloacimonadota bacterium]
MSYLIAFVIVIIAYLYGSFSTARIVTKSVRSLNVYKVGSGFADTENIYANISKPLGVLVGALDVAKAYVFLLIVEMVLRLIDRTGSFSGISTLYQANLMLLYGTGMLVGHCLPYSHHFRGGRGIFTYMGFLAYFAFYPMLITAIIAWILVARFKQIRFAQYLVVILPVVLFQVFYSVFPVLRKDLPPYFVPIMLGVALLMGILNILVSKKLGEI